MLRGCGDFSPIKLEAALADSEVIKVRVVIEAPPFRNFFIQRVAVVGQTFASARAGEVTTRVGEATAQEHSRMKRLFSFEPCWTHVAAVLTSTALQV